MIILQMPELEDLGCVGAFDSRATEFNIEVFQNYQEMKCTASSRLGI